MITKKFTIYTRTQKIALKLVDIIQGVWGLTLLTSVFISMIVTQDEKKWNIWIIIIGLSGIISLVEIIVRMTFNKQSFFHTLLIKKFKSNVLLFSQTPMQAEVCSWIKSNIQNGKGILIYGKANIGKTTSIFIFLSQHTKDKDLLKQLNWTENIIYIDCKNRKSDILDFFCNEKEQLYSIQYEKSLLIVDNLETMGETFCANLLNTINSAAGTFILLVDANKMGFERDNSLAVKFMHDNYMFLTDEKDTHDFRDVYIRLSDQEKNVFLIIYYISLSTTLVAIKEVFSILNRGYSIRKFKLIIRVLLRKGLIKRFPFDHSYIILKNRMAIIKNQKIFWNTSHNFKAIFIMLKNSDKFPESAWLSMVYLPYEYLLKQDMKEKEILFGKALNCGNYVTLYHALKEELTFDPNKENMFLYELGTLLFYNSCQEQAFEKYNKLIEKAPTDDTKYATMLRIIEATHGDTDPSVLRNNDAYIKRLMSAGSRYALYAEYWWLHIETERGNFNLKSYKDLLDKLLNLEKSESVNDIHFELIKRCYTDIIRSLHILKGMPTEDLKSGFLKFMRENYDKTMYRYYVDLYINANSLHYVTLLDDILNKRNCQDTYNKAYSYYRAALRNGIEKQKSVSACELKCIDLMLFNPENMKNFSDFYTKIMKFLSNAEINRVSVHVAYCETLLAKLYIVKNLQSQEFFTSGNNKFDDTEIKKNLNKAKKIYRKYKNEYGMIRIEFLETLYRFAMLSDAREEVEAIQKMADILEEHQEYQREIDIIKFLQRNDKSRMSVISIIKAYPIIMQ